MELILDSRKGVFAEDAETLEKLRKNHFGTLSGRRISMRPEEAMYLMNFQNANVSMGRKPIGFNELASHFMKSDPRLFIKYNAYRDWRDRGLVVKRLEDITKRGSKKAYKKYPARKMEAGKAKAHAVWYPDSLFSVIEDPAVGKHLFDDYWLGQFGIYKQDRGDLLKLNSMETIFLSKHFSLDVVDSATGKKLSPEKTLRQVMNKREYAKPLYEVYEEWRLRGYVVKTGFKFGSHFRIYFPGASPTKPDKWIHSKHVLHVFPKDQKLLVSEWSRAVRVAHGVRKTFLLGIPKLTKKDHVEYPADFAAYRRKKVKGSWIRETPEDKPRYLLVPVAEDEHIGGIELASLLEKASSLGLELLLSITDRETSITYYLLKRVVLPGSKYEYYEIEWMKP